MSRSATHTDPLELPEEAESILSNSASSIASRSSSSDSLIVTQRDCLREYHMHALKTPKTGLIAKRTAHVILIQPRASRLGPEIARESQVRWHDQSQGVRSG